MTNTYVETPETRLNDLIRDVAVAGYLAKDRRLDPDYAGQLAARVKAAATAMLEPGDAQLLKTTANTLERASTRIKAGTAPRPRAKASSGNGSRSVPQPDYLALSRAQDLERMASAGPFSVNNHAADEARRAAEANRQLAARQRRHEAQRRQQVEQDRRPKGPERR